MEAAGAGTCRQALPRNCTDSRTVAQSPVSTYAAACAGSDLLRRAANTLSLEDRKTDPSPALAARDVSHLLFQNSNGCSCPVATLVVLLASWATGSASWLGSTSCRRDIWLAVAYGSSANCVSPIANFRAAQEGPGEYKKSCLSITLKTLWTLVSLSCTVAAQSHEVRDPKTVCL